MHDLISSTFALHSRFNTAQGWMQAVRIFVEEKHEFFEAYRDGDIPHAAEEAADVLVTVVGMAMAAGVTEAQLNAAVQIVIDKNDGKTQETHYLCQHTGKIRRK